MVAGNRFFNVGGNAFSGNAFLPGGGSVGGLAGDANDAGGLLGDGGMGDEDVMLVSPGKVSLSRNHLGRPGW